MNHLYCKTATWRGNYAVISEKVFTLRSGLIPVKKLNSLIKWARSVNPHSAAISAQANSGYIEIYCRSDMNRSIRQSRFGEMPIEGIKIRSTCRLLIFKLSAISLTNSWPFEF